MSKNPLIVLGIDPGIADTGYGVVEIRGAKLACLSYGSIKTPAGALLPKRLETIAAELDKLIKKYRPGLAAVEELFFCANAKTALVVGQARGVALLVAQQNRLKIKEFKPNQVKQAVAAYGHADKKQVQNMVRLILNLPEPPRPDDAADALALAICAANSAF